MVIDRYGRYLYRSQDLVWITSTLGSTVNSLTMEPYFESSSSISGSDEEMNPFGSPTKNKVVFCSHCGTNVPKPTYYCHRELASAKMLAGRRHSLPSNSSSDSECDGVSVSPLPVDLLNDRSLETNLLDEDDSELLPEILTPRTATESDGSCSVFEVNLIVTAGSVQFQNVIRISCGYYNI